jgi:hypothetical protein
MLKKFVPVICLAGLLTSAALAQPAPSPAAEAAKQGSLYVQCDGNPNNMSAGESIARLIALSAVIGLLAPPPEQPDASKRKFGEAGVAACTGILEGDKAEGNAVRRVPLILARALHRIEAKDYAGAVRDVEIARAEAKAGGLAGDPYFERSTGLSFNRIEGEARIRMGDVAGARSVSMAEIDQFRFNYYPLQAALAYSDFGPPFDERALRLYSYAGKFEPALLLHKADLLDIQGNFAESFIIVEGLLTEQRAMRLNESPRAGFFAGAAVAAALADRWEQAQSFATEGRQKLRAAAAEGKPDDNAANVIELLDFYDILKLARDGDLKSARRNFAARSEWLAPRFGQLLEVHRRLTAGATAVERIGLLARTADELRKERRNDAMAMLLDRDKNNRTLFANILPYANAASFERLSKRVWSPKTSKIIGKEKVKDTDSYFAFLYDADFMTQFDAMLLHGALQAKARGKQGFTFLVNRKEPKIGFLRFVNPDEPGVFSQRYFDSDAVIADLRKIIPSPDEIAARRTVAK